VTSLLQKVKILRKLDKEIGAEAVGCHHGVNKKKSVSSRQMEVS
jgi:hypothetical protein